MNSSCAYYFGAASLLVLFFVYIRTSLKLAEIKQSTSSEFWVSRQVQLYPVKKMVLKYFLCIYKS